MNAIGIDIARYEGFFNPDIAQTVPDFVIQKATEGDFYIDSLYEFLWLGVKKIGIRGAYHYQRSSSSWKSQADYFLSVAAKHDYHFYSLDLEEYGNTYSPTFFADARRIIDYWRSKTTKPIILYTNWVTYNQMATALTALYPDGKVWLNNVPFWIAYPNNSPGNPLLPPSRSTWTIHQYSWKGSPSKWGTDGNAVDENVYNGTVEEMRGWLHLDPLSVTIPFSGVEYYQLTKQDVKVYVLLIDLKNKQVQVNYSPNLAATSTIALQKGSQIAVNGQDWDFHTQPPYLPNGTLVVAGKVIWNDKSGVPFLNVGADNTLSMPWNDYNNLYNTVSGFRYLVQGGIKQGYLDDLSKIDNIEKHARSAKGITKDGRLILVVADGTYTMEYGLTLSQLADVFVQFGAQVAMDNDSGGSSTLWIKDRVVNVPSDGHERAVVSHLLIQIGGSMDYYEIKCTDAVNHSIRADHAITAGTVASLVPNTIAKGGATDTDVYTYTSNVLNPAGGYYAKAGDKWRKVYQNNGVNISGWIAEIHLGVVQNVSFTLISVSPPPSTLPELNLTIEAAGYPVTKVNIKPL